MSGVITTRHLLTHAHLIVRGFGVRTWARCALAILSGRAVTFLALAVSLDKL